MNFLPFLAVGIILKIVAIFWFICAVVLVLVILIQKGRGGGLSAAFGGGMGGGLLGSKTGDFLTWVTIGLISAFIILAVVMAKFYKPGVSDYGGAAVGQQEPISSAQPAGTSRQAGSGQLASPVPTQTDESRDLARPLIPVEPAGENDRAD